MVKRQAPDIPALQVVRVPFHIGTAAEFRIQRADGDEVNAIRVEGLASVFGYEYTVYGGPPYGWVERIEEGAFDQTLADDPDVVFLLNHDGLPLARTKSGTMELSTVDTGLQVRADFDTVNPDVQKLGSALNRGDVDEMSFAFRTTAQEWRAHDDYPDDDQSLRMITEVNLHRGDVSAVTFGASDATDIDIVRSLEALNVEELAEARAVIDRRLNQQPGGMPGEDRGGMPPHLLELLRIH